MTPEDQYIEDVAEDMKRIMSKRFKGRKVNEGLKGELKSFIMHYDMLLHLGLCWEHWMYRQVIQRTQVTRRGNRVEVSWLRG